MGEIIATLVLAAIFAKIVATMAADAIEILEGEEE